MTKILIVDDEKDIIQLIRDFSILEKFEIIEANSGEEALELFDDSISLIVLDVNMDGISGLDVCKTIRKKSYVPIIFLTCNNSQADMILGLCIGADDYITKPFNPIELIARIKTNIRRFKNYSSNQIENNKDDIIIFGDITVYNKSFKVCKNCEDINITTKEFTLLKYLIKNAHIVLSRTQILINVWGDTHYDENLVNTTIKRLRRKIEDDPENPKYIKTIWGAGYIFDVEIK